MVQIPFLNRQPHAQDAGMEEDDDLIHAPVEDRRVYPLRLNLTVLDTNQVISVQLSDCLLVGRDDDSQTDIDFAHLDGARLGISRLHAAFLYDGRGLAIEDLNSRNGTRINGYRIEGGKPYPIRNGDELEIGFLRVLVHLERAPK